MWQPKPSDVTEEEFQRPKQGIATSLNSGSDSHRPTWKNGKAITLGFFWANHRRSMLWAGPAGSTGIASRRRESGIKIRAICIIKRNMASQTCTSSCGCARQSPSLLRTYRKTTLTSTLKRMQQMPYPPAIMPNIPLTELSLEHHTSICRNSTWEAPLTRSNIPRTVPMASFPNFQPQQWHPVINHVRFFNTKRSPTRCAFVRNSPTHARA